MTRETKLGKLLEEFRQLEQSERESEVSSIIEAIRDRQKKIDPSLISEKKVKLKMK